MTHIHTSGFERAAQGLADLLQSRRITGRNASTRFQESLRHPVFRQQWDHLWSSYAELLGGQLDVSAVLRILKHVRTSTSIPDDWSTTAAFALPALEALVRAGAFDGFSGWLFAASEADENEQSKTARAAAA